MKKILNISKFIIVLSIILIPFSPTVHAQTGYTLLEPTIPGIYEKSGKVTLQSYLPGMFKLIIASAAVLAFIMLTFGGITYAVSDSLTGKQDGRKYVTNALTGLLLVIGAYAILYTINPKILNFSLDIKRPSVTRPTTTVVPGTTTTTGVGCQGDCPYSYISNGTLIKYKDCYSCSPATSFGYNIKTKSIDGKAAQINTSLGNRLKAINAMSGTTSFTLTETWPPTVNHKNQGQYDGTSVDLRLENPTAANINNFIKNAKTQGVAAKYEVGTDAQKDAYVKAGVPWRDILVVPYITGEHFSIK